MIHHSVNFSETTRGQPEKKARVEGVPSRYKRDCQQMVMATASVRKVQLNEEKAHQRREREEAALLWDRVRKPINGEYPLQVPAWTSTTVQY